MIAESPAPRNSGCRTDLDMSSSCCGRVIFLGPHPVLECSLRVLLSEWWVQSMPGDKCGGGYTGPWDVQAPGDHHTCPKCARGYDTNPTK